MKYDTALALIFTTLFVVGCSTTDQPSTSEAGIGNIKLIGQIEGSGLAVSEVGVTRDLTVVGNYVYVAIPRCTLDTDDGRYSCNEHWLRVVDISDPTNPVEVALHPMPYPASAMTASDNHIYVAQGHLGLRILDVSDPRSLTEIASCELSSLREVDDIAVVKSYAYVSGRRCITESDCSFGLWILDISNPTAPAEISFRGMVGDSIYNVLVADNYVLVIRGHTGEGPIATLTFTGNLQRIDKSNPIVLAEIGSSLDLRASALNMVVSGSYVHTSYGQEGLWAIDMSDPLAPSEAVSYNTPDGIWGVTMTEGTGGYLCAVDSKGAVYILQFTSTAISDDN